MVAVAEQTGHPCEAGGVVEGLQAACPALARRGSSRGRGQQLTDEFVALQEHAPQEGGLQREAHQPAEVRCRVIQRLADSEDHREDQ